MNTQEIGFSEIMQIITSIFFAALLLGFIIAVGKLIYEFIIWQLGKQKAKKPFDYEKESQKFIKKLSVHKDVKYLDVYYSDQDDHWEYYYRILGIYKGVQFLIYINKGHETAREISLIKRISKDPQEIQTFLKTLTNLKFELS
jgi:hypothetical protein